MGYLNPTDSLLFLTGRVLKEIELGQTFLNPPRFSRLFRKSGHHSLVYDKKYIKRKLLRYTVGPTFWGC